MSLSKAGLNYVYRTEKVRVEFKAFSNLTTRTHLYTALPNRNTQSTAKIIGFTDDQVTLEIPITWCARGHHVLVEAQVFSKTQKIVFRTTAKVISTEGHPKERLQKVELHMLQFDQESFKEMMAIFSSQQAQIADLFERMRD